ncbi:MAG: RND family efflux transporter MFP subunit [Saprospiraceae bacterium]|jgi:RND family efflux transporter MFP subunit
MTNIKYIYILSFVCLLMSCKQSGSPEQVYNAGDKNTMPSVEVTNPSVRSFSSDQMITGTIMADQSIHLHSMEQGMLKSIYVDIGDRVSKGQVIAKLSNPVLSYQLKSAEAQLMQSQSALKSAEALLTVNEASSNVAKGLYDKLMSVNEKSSGLTTMAERENAKRDAQMSAANVEVGKAQIEQAQSEVSSSETMVSAIKVRLSMLSIKAPFSGVITGRFADPGSMIQNALSDNNAKPLVSLASISPVRLTIPIPESDVSGINVGDEVNITFPSLGGSDQSAKISRISNNLDQASKTMEVQVDIPNKDGKIRAGMYAKAEIKRVSSGDMLSLPLSAISMKKDAAFVYVVNDGVVQEIKLKKGLSSKDYFEVLNDNITAKSKVVTKGKSMIKDGTKVNAILK